MGEADGVLPESHFRKYFSIGKSILKDSGKTRIHQMPLMKEDFDKEHFGYTEQYMLKPSVKCGLLEGYQQ